LNADEYKNDNSSDEDTTGNNNNSGGMYDNYYNDSGNKAKKDKNWTSINNDNEDIQEEDTANKTAKAPA
jgi:hypothetical protein